MVVSGEIEVNLNTAGENTHLLIRSRWKDYKIDGKSQHLFFILLVPDHSL